MTLAADDRAAEIEHLQKLRATLEAVRQSTAKIHEDIEAATKNHQAIRTETERAHKAFKEL